MWFLNPFFLRIQQVGSEAYGLGLSCFHISSIGAACVCFLELLGLDSLKLRVDMKVANIILNYKCGSEDAQYNSIRESLGIAPLCRLFCLKDKGQIGLKHWIVSGWGTVIFCFILFLQNVCTLSHFFGPLMGFWNVSGPHFPGRSAQSLESPGSPVVGAGFPCSGPGPIPVRS